MARIIFEYDPAEPGNVEVELDISKEDRLDSVKLVEVLATGVNSAIVSCWDTNDDREHAALGVAKLLLLAVDQRRSDDDE